MSDTAKITHSEFKSFNCILDFIEQLKEAICQDDSKQYHEVVLYNHLIHKIKITNKQNIRRHLSLFSEFCARNADAILNKDSSLIVFQTIKYSDRVFINLGNILKEKTIDNEIKEAIWKHLLVIYASVDPSSKARSVLMGLTESNVPEEKMISGLIGEISKHVSENDERNPMDIFSSLMQSGVVNKMMSSLDSSVKNGDIDMNKLGSTIQGMMTGLMGSAGGKSDAAGGNAPPLDLGNMMSGLLGAMGGKPDATGGNAPPLDLGNMMSGLLGAMGGGKSESVEGNSPSLDLGNMMSTMMGVMSATSNTSGLSGTNPEHIRQQLEKQVEEELKKEKETSSLTIEISGTDKKE